MTEHEKQAAIRAAFEEYPSDSNATRKVINTAKFVERSLEPDALPKYGTRVA